MRRRWLVILPLAACAGPASAQAPLPPPARGALEFAIDIGHTRYATDVVRPDGMRLGLFLTRHFTPRIAGTFDITCTGGSPAGAPADESFTICTGAVGAQLEAGVSRRARPYLRAAYGQAQLDASAAEWQFDIDDRGGATTAAAGIRFPFGRSGRFAGRLEAAWVRHDLVGGPATHRSVALGVACRFR